MGNIRKSSTLVPGGNSFPIVYQKDIQGGFHSVNNYEELQSLIDNNRVTEGTIVKVRNSNIIYEYVNELWSELSINSGIPIYDLEMIELQKDNLPNKYITIPNITDESLKKDSYLDILFESIRTLQSEVARLKNSFLYGIVSYKDLNTAMSNIVEEGEEEPLWAIDEDSLSEIESIRFGTQCQLQGSFESNNNIIQINDTAVWNLSLENIDDPKLLIYLTTTGKDIQFTLLNMLNGKYTYFNLKDFILNDASFYNILIIISRSLENGYVYFNVENKLTQSVLLTGYLNGNDVVSELKEIDKFTLSKITFKNLNIIKGKIYSKYQDFSNNIIPSKPNDDDYKYQVSHLTIRSVESYDIAKKILDLLLDDELIFIRNIKTLCIKSNNQLITFKQSSDLPDDIIPSTNMDLDELFKILLDAGLITADQIEDGSYANIALNLQNGITLFNEDTQQAFDVTVDASGNLITKLNNKKDTIDYKLLHPANVTLSDNHVRGTLGQIGLSLYKYKDSSINVKSDLKLYADRIKIAQVYTPTSYDNSLGVYGCSHAFIELENTSDQDFSLKGCYLYYTTPELRNDGRDVIKLELSGTIKAGSTYLIRGKQYADFNDANCFIKVKTFDQEWYDNGTLLDMSVISTQAYSLALIYGNSNITSITPLVSAFSELTIDGIDFTSSDKSTYPYLYKGCYIDSFSWGLDKDNTIVKNNGTYCWAPSGVTLTTNNSIIKNTFELDPAKQAFQSCNTKDSSRARNAKLADLDAQILLLDEEFITFPHSDYKKAVSDYTPKASFENKNVCTDKSKLNKNHPNMITCSFGINAFTTRTFNWISCGYFDEYVFIKINNQWVSFESYVNIENPNIQETTAPFRKEFSVNTNNVIYARRTGRFPADNTFYTAHKCIVLIENNPVTTPTTYEYVIARKTKDGTIDYNYCSDIYTFTLYPSDYTPVIYQTSDQQGFHWIEYQVWNGVANALNDKINRECTLESKTFPVLINTGDMTQNGTRINEWYDYYTAGSKLFKHLEQVNCVGNNDLCGSINDGNIPAYEILGTGDDNGKSNSYYFHLFYCYEINEGIKDINGEQFDITPIINNKYLPSLYYIDFQNYRLIVVNSEFTESNCKNWYNLIANDNIINIYTGFELGTDVFHDEFTSIYTMLYYMYYSSGNKQIITMCHEMPFTVITNSSLSTDTTKGTDLATVFRSLSGSSLIGSHTNQLSYKDTGKGIYWFSRLLEYFNKSGKAKLVLGGHKHTYVITYPIREYYYYNSGVEETNSLESGPMDMEPTLKNDSAVWTGKVVSLNDLSKFKNTTKFPLTKCANVGDKTSTYFYPYTPVENLEGGIVYAMCQASGYKLTSNKELPSAEEKFAYILPKTVAGTSSDSPSNYLKIPIFARITPTNTGNYGLTLYSVNNIMKSGKFSLQNIVTAPIELKQYDVTKDWTHSTGTDDTNPWVNINSNETLII